MEEYWLTIGAAALVAALTSAVVSIWGVSRNIRHKAVIEERQNWRHAIRELVPKLIDQDDDASREAVRNEIVLRLNPYKDQAAVRLLAEYSSAPSAELGHAIVTHFQAMLKVEWERAKKEAGFIPWGAGWRADIAVRIQKWRSAKREAAAVAARPSIS